MLLRSSSRSRVDLAVVFGSVCRQRQAARRIIQPPTPLLLLRPRQQEQNGCNNNSSSHCFCSSSGGATKKTGVGLTLKTDPSRFVANVTRERLEKDSVLFDYFRANYPEAFEEDISEEAEEEEEEEDGQDDDDDDEMIAAVLQSSTYVRREKVIYPRNIRPLTTYRRDAESEEGSRACRRLRKNGWIPGILYGSDPTLGIYSYKQPESSKILIKTPWRVLQGELDRHQNHFESRVYHLTVRDEVEEEDEEEEAKDDEDDGVFADGSGSGGGGGGGTVHTVIPQNVQRHPFLPAIYCANFCRYHPGRPVRVPIVYVNEEESPALKRDGFIVPIQKYAECVVDDGADIPESIEMECIGLVNRDVIRKDRLLMPEGVKFTDRVMDRGDEYVIGVVVGKSREQILAEIEAEKQAEIEASGGAALPADSSSADDADDKE